MVRARARHPFTDEYEREFPYKIDIPVPPTGLGRDLTEMLEWCRERVPQLGWAYHGHTRRLSKGASPIHYTRRYFIDEEDAEAFRQAWLSRQRNHPIRG